MEPPADQVVAPAESKQEFGTDCQDELSSLDDSPMVISPIVGLSPSQGEDDVDLAHILAEFGTLPAFVTPIIDHYAEREMPPHGIPSAGGTNRFGCNAGWAGR